MTKSFTPAVLPALLPTLLLALAVLPSPAGAVDTDLTVRVISKGAKFVGSSMGGVRITVRDAATGELLARGVTAGSTGDTGKIMREEHGRDRVLSTEGSAAWTTTLDLEEPRHLEITAEGPLAQPQATNRASLTQWVVPGKHVTGGDAFLLELPGFNVDVLAPPAHLRPGPAPLDVPIRANVTMMCGCPVTPGGLWDADAYEIRAVVRRGGDTVADLPMAYAGTASQFEATFRAEEPGLHTVLVYAYDPADGNTGLDRTTFIVPEESSP